MTLYNFKGGRIVPVFIALSAMGSAMCGAYGTSRVAFAVRFYLLIKIFSLLKKGFFLLQNILELPHNLIHQEVLFY